VAFIRGDGPQAVLVTAREDGTGASTLTSARDYVAGGSAGVRRLANGAREAGAWSPDGSRIIFGNASYPIRVVTLDGTISTLPFRGCLPSWQP
jgi:hypothetical protein